jgi:hypothetical protein
MEIYCIYTYEDCIMKPTNTLGKGESGEREMGI